MKKRFQLTAAFLAIALLILLYSGCEQKQEEEIFNETNLAFSYRLPEQEYEQGGSIYIDIEWENTSQYPVTYVGSDGSKGFATLFCTVEGKDYSFSQSPDGMSSGDQDEYIVQPGKKQGDRYYFDIPVSAPCGQYHLQVIYKGAKEIFYNVFTLSEEG